jgi:alpha-tubulin suppressor-like RCC1 family protein
MRRPAVVAALIVLVACDGPFVAPPPYSPGPGVPHTVTVTPDSATITKDDTLRLSAVVRDSTGAVLTGTAVAWVSADTTIAVVVNAFGTVRGRQPGRTTIRAYAGAVAGAVTVFVTPVVYLAVATGANHACALGNNGHAYCWGKNDDAQVGTGTSSLVEPAPRLVTLTPALVAVTAGTAHSCALDAAGTASCWGREVNGRLGRDGSPGDPAVPSSVVPSTPFVAIAAGGAHTCALTTSGHALCWGAGAYGQLGAGDTLDRNTPTQALGDFGWSTVTAGTSHTCALAASGLAECWGANTAGQLGDSALVNRSDPTPVSGGLLFTDISAGGLHTCAVSAELAYCWGANTQGESGSGLPDSILPQPTPVGGGLQFRSITAGGQHSCGIAVDSTAYCWGANGSGQLGDGTGTDRALPVPVTGGMHYTVLRAGAAFTCGLTSTLVLYCWGDGTQGQLGRVILGSSSVPVKVVGQ